MASKRRGRGRGRSKSGRQALTTAQRHLKAIELRVAGLTLEQIATKLNYRTRAGALKAIELGMKKAYQEPTDKLRHIEKERLDAMWAKVWGKFDRSRIPLETMGQLVRLLLKISNRRAALLGLDSPVRHQVTAELDADLSAKVQMTEVSSEDLMSVLVEEIRADPEARARLLEELGKKRRQERSQHDRHQVSEFQGQGQGGLTVLQGNDRELADRHDR